MSVFRFTVGLLLLIGAVAVMESRPALAQENDPTVAPTGELYVIPQTLEVGQSA